MGRVWCCFLLAVTRGVPLWLRSSMRGNCSWLGLISVCRSCSASFSTSQSVRRQFSQASLLQV
ncbi:hypothetical protein CIB84_007636 [Bambusicola thoracicus]|uniref:Secreted protein n=1 Tax=Bambusicola thoracicus TaxID=9083 RepID=A0A2P4SWW6_BAMTH|nr:hypothetical protein CIB84_007636 [Bambusicola thoracicus]